MAGGLNRYTYVENNPANLIDPTGQVAQAIRLVEPVGVGVGASFACILNVDLCRAVITEVCNDISQAVDSLVDLILNNESSDDGNPDIKKPGTARNLDGTRKSPMDQEDQLRDFRDSGGLVDDMSKSRGRRKSFLKDLKDIPLDELDDFLDGNGI